MSELSDKISGKAKQVAGDATDNKKLKAEGKMEETRGKIKGAANDVANTVRQKADEAKKKLDK